MRPHPFAALALLLGAGCLAPGVPDADPTVEPLAFDRSDSRWVAVTSGGCGLCSGQGGFGPHAEHHAAFVFENARALLVDFNVGVNEGATLSIGPNVTFDPTELRSLLGEVPRIRDGRVYVVRVYTGVVDDGTPGALAEAWTRPGPTHVAADFGVHYGHAPAEGDAEHVTLTGPLAQEDDPFHRFARPMHAIHEGLRMAGERQGPAPP